MQCPETKGLLVAYVVDGLDEDDLARLRSHLETCAACTALLTEYRQLWSTLGAAAGGTSDEQAHRLQETITAYAGDVGVRDTRAPTARGWPWRRWSVGVAAVLAIALAGAVGGAAYQRSRAASAAFPGADTTLTQYLVLMRGIELARSRDSLVGPALTRWFTELSDEGRLVGGSPVADSAGAWVGAQPSTTSLDGVFALDGYMLIQARTFAAARAIASRAPHLSAGGAIELWALRRRAR